MLLYFQEVPKEFYKHSFIKQICNTKAEYVMCQKSIYIINLFFFKKKKIQLAAIELRNGKLFFFLVFLQFMVQFHFSHF